VRELGGHRLGRLLVGRVVPDVGNVEPAGIGQHGVNLRWVPRRAPPLELDIVTSLCAFGGRHDCIEGRQNRSVRQVASHPWDHAELGTRDERGDLGAGGRGDQRVGIALHDDRGAADRAQRFAAVPAATPRLALPSESAAPRPWPLARPARDDVSGRQRRDPADVRRLGGRTARDLESPQDHLTTGPR
jgi:hypothetical protein